MTAELYRIIQGAEGALADAGSVVVDPIEEGIRQLTAERDRLRSALRRVQEVVTEQAEDQGLWFIAEYTPPRPVLTHRLTTTPEGTPEPS